MRRPQITAIPTWMRSSRTAQRSGPKVQVTADGRVMTVTITRPEVRNAVDPETASALKAAFESFDQTDSLAVAVLTGVGGHFCAGYDLKALAAAASNQLPETGGGPMGPTRMLLTKPVIAAIEGYAVAGGAGLAVWWGLRGAPNKASLGGFNPGVWGPLICSGPHR